MNDIEWKYASANFKIQAQAACRALIALGVGERAGRSMAGCLPMGLEAFSSGSGSAKIESQAPLAFALEGASFGACRDLGRALGESPALAVSRDAHSAAIETCAQAAIEQGWGGARVVGFLAGLGSASAAGKKWADDCLNAIMARCVYSYGRELEWYCWDPRAARDFSRFWTDAWMRSFLAAPSAGEYHLKALGAAYSGAAFAALKSADESRGDSLGEAQELEACRIKMESFAEAGGKAAELGWASEREISDSLNPHPMVLRRFRSGWDEGRASDSCMQKLTQALPENWLARFLDDDLGAKARSECEKALLLASGQGVARLAARRRAL